MAGFALFGTTSCNDMLDVDPDGHITMKDVFVDRQRTMGYLNQCYTHRAYAFCMQPALSALTDETYDAGVLNQGNSSYAWYSAGMDVDTYNGINQDIWGQMFQGIRETSNFIDYAPSFTGYQTEHELEGWTAQAHVLRAWYYTVLMANYGHFPLYTHNVSTDYWNLKKAAYGDIVKQILADCDSALNTQYDELTGFSWNIRSDENGIMTRGVAEAIRSRAILMACSPLYNDGTYTWADAVKVTGDALAACLTDGGYELWNERNESQNLDAYAAYFLQNPIDRREKDRETIYANGGRFTVWKDYGLPSTGSQTGAYLSPTQELVDCYETADGDQPILGYKDAEHTQPIYNTNCNYDPAQPYLNRDPRFYASIYYNQAPRDRTGAGSKVANIYAGGVDETDTTSVRHTQTGYYLRKYNSDLSKLNSNADGYYREFRLAELYYNFAEAAYQAGTPDQVYDLGYGIQMSAKQAVDIVRARAGMPEVPSGLSKEEFEKRYRNDRMVEFAFEGMRYFDIRRWMIMPDVFGHVSGVMAEKKEDDSGYVYTRFAHQTRVATDSKYYFAPLRRTEVNKIRNATGADWQNPGWGDSEATN